MAAITVEWMPLTGTVAQDFDLCFFCMIGSIWAPESYSDVFFQVTFQIRGDIRKRSCLK
jgi:hypothetical protein